MARRIVGQQQAIELLLTALCTGGHSLLVGVPGLAKTLMVRSLAEVLNLEFKRVQFTPDLMPADIIGSEVLVEDRTSGQRSFKYVPGPVFTNILLADEINRTPPKTQAALLEAMQEKAVSVGGVTRPLPEPYLVFATQNPIEQEGTYPLPEAELDRFMFFIGVDYPAGAEEEQVVLSTTGVDEPCLEKIMGPADILEAQRLVRSVPVAPVVVKYAVRLARSTRPAQADAPDFVRRHVTWGAGPRAGQFLVLGAKARALFQGRAAANADDIRALAPAVLRHRLILNIQAQVDRISSLEIIERLLEKVQP